jgi:hypothetical protein
MLGQEIAQKGRGRDSNSPGGVLAKDPRPAAGRAPARLWRSRPRAPRGTPRARRPAPASCGRWARCLSWWSAARPPPEEASRVRVAHDDSPATWQGRARGRRPGLRVARARHNRWTGRGRQRRSGRFAGTSHATPPAGLSKIAHAVQQHRAGPTGFNRS